MFVFLLKCKIHQTKWHFKPMNGVGKAVALGSRSKEMMVVGEGKVEECGRAKKQDRRNLGFQRSLLTITNKPRTKIRGDLSLRKWEMKIFVKKTRLL